MSPGGSPLMLEYVGSQRTGLRERRHEALDVLSVVRSIDWLLLAGVIGVVALGLWAINGITHHDIATDPHYFVKRQAAYALIGLVGLVVFTLIDPDVWRLYWRWVFGGTAAMIAIVYLAGPVTRGSKRWLDLGFFKFQPSEFGKLLFVLALAGFLAERGRRISESRTMLQAIGLAAIPVGLVFLQPDIGTALVYVAALAAVLFVSGTRWTHLTAASVVAIVGIVSILWLLPAAGVHVLKPYQQSRLTGFTHPTSDPAGSTYNINQSIVAVASGQLRGRGVAGATQTNLNFLPEHATDFVFASYGEQRGFVGATLLLGLYLLLVWRGLRIVTIARDLFSAIVAGGIVVALLFQIFVNVGMTMGIAPITGIPLPFVSVGGSSMIANLCAMGVLLAIHARGRGARASR
jgi:rod shape determining protein RodA